MSERYFTHNWADQVKVETFWPVDLSESSETQAEERHGLSGYPNRTVTFKWSTLSQKEAQEVYYSLKQAGTDGNGIDFPLYCDQAVLTATTGIGGTEIFCDTTYKRFVVGQHVVLVGFHADGSTYSELGLTITAVAANKITVTSISADSVGGPYAFPAGSFVYPNIYQDPQASSPQISYFTDGASEVTATFKGNFFPGFGQDTTDQPGTNPAGFSTYLGWPIFDAETDWTTLPTVEFVQAGGTFTSGIYSWPDVPGAYAKTKVSFNALEFDRASVYRLIRFYDSRGGIRKPFWFVLPMGLFEPAVIDPGFVDVERGIFLDTLEALLPYVGIVLTDGTQYIRGVSSIVDTGTYFRIAFDAVIPAMTLAQIARVSPAMLCRFDTQLTEQWSTDTVCDLTFSLTEVRNEDTVVVS